MTRSIFDLTPEEERSIEAAVAEAEKNTAGEIVLYFSESSDSYEDSVLKAGGIMLAAGLFVSLAVELLFPRLFGQSAAVTAAFSVFAGFCGILLTLIFPRLRVIAAGKKTVNRRVYQKALEAFLAEEVFRTKDRTGILIFISQAERKVMVLGDSGINKKVKQSDWDQIVKIITDGIKRNNFAEGLISAVHQCGKLLAESGLPVKPEDANELSNEIRRG